MLGTPNWLIAYSTEYRKNRVRTPPVVRASGVGSARSVLEVNGNNAL